MIALNDMQSTPTDVEVLNATTSVTTRDDGIEMSNTANTSSSNNDNDIEVLKSTADTAAVSDSVGTSITFGSNDVASAAAMAVAAAATSASAAEGVANAKGASSREAAGSSSKINSSIVHSSGMWFQQSLRSQCADTAAAAAPWTVRGAHDRGARSLRQANPGLTTEERTYGPQTTNATLSINYVSFPILRGNHISKS